MNKSTDIDKLAQSLSQLQSEIQNVYKDKSGYGYKYTELSSILDVVRPLCAKYHLAVSQLGDNNPADPDVVGVETVLMHNSGQYISSSLYMRVTASKGMSAAQAAGSVITYARRYALAAILGIAQTDDDAAAPREEIKPIDKTTEINLRALIDLKKVEEVEVNRWLQKACVSSVSDLSLDQANKIIDLLNKRENK